jgi:hypothetical protein
MNQTAAGIADLNDDALLEQIQRQTFAFFWDGGHPGTGLAPDRRQVTGGPIDDDLVAIGGSGFGLMATVVAIERGWVSRAQGLMRLTAMVGALARARRHHGAWPHFMNGATGETIAFGPLDDGGDLVETSFLCMGLICVRQYLDNHDGTEARLGEQIDRLLDGVEWDWYARGDTRCLYWHWSPVHGWAMNHEIRGWNECLITYVMAIASRTHGVDPAIYHNGYAAGPHFLNGSSYYDIVMPLGMPFGGPLFFTHYSFCGLDPRGLTDRYANYWDLNRRQVAIQQEHARRNPGRFSGYGMHNWGLTASDDPDGYAAHDPANDNGTISPTAALSSMPYAPGAALAAARYWLRRPDTHSLWQRFGFIDAFNDTRGWQAEYFLAIDQGPIVVMIENHRSALLWRLFMSSPMVQKALRAMDFHGPWLNDA